MLRRLGTLPALAVTGTIMVACQLVIHFLFVPGTGGTLLDFALTGKAAEEALALLKSRPNAVGLHLYLSAGVDMVYPLAYGSFLAGICFRYGAPRGLIFALPVFAAAGFDMAENTVQVLAMTGDPSILALKTVLTPAKFLLAGIGCVVAIWLWSRTTFGSRELDSFFHPPSQRSGS